MIPRHTPALSSPAYSAPQPNSGGFSFEGLPTSLADEATSLSSQPWVLWSMRLAAARAVNEASNSLITPAHVRVTGAAASGRRLASDSGSVVLQLILLPADAGPTSTSSSSSSNTEPAVPQVSSAELGVDIPSGASQAWVELWQASDAVVGELQATLQGAAAATPDATPVTMTQVGVATPVEHVHDAQLQGSSTPRGGALGAASGDEADTDASGLASNIGMVVGAAAVAAIVVVLGVSCYAGFRRRRHTRTSTAVTSVRVVPAEVAGAASTHSQQRARGHVAALHAAPSAWLASSKARVLPGAPQYDDHNSL